MITTTSCCCCERCEVWRVLPVKSRHWINSTINKLVECSIDQPTTKGCNLQPTKPETKARPLLSQRFKATQDETTTQSEKATKTAARYCSPMDHSFDWIWFGIFHLQPNPFHVWTWLFQYDRHNYDTACIATSRALPRTQNILVQTARHEYYNHHGYLYTISPLHDRTRPPLSMELLGAATLWLLVELLWSVS